MLATAAVALALLGCGGGGDDAAKAGFISRADAICRAGDAQVKALQDDIAAAQRGSDQQQVYAELARLTRRSVAISTPYLDRLDALSIPAGDRDEIKGWIADSRRQVALVAQLSRAFAVGDDARIATLSEQIDALATRNDAFAARYGMHECAKSR